MSRTNRAFWLSCFLVVGVFAAARYGALPSIGFVLDDWSLLNRAESQDSMAHLAANALGHPARPIGTLMLLAVYRIYGEHLGLYVADILVGFSLFLVLGMWTAFRLTGSRRAALLFGWLAAAWPGYHELFYWPNLMRSGSRLPLFMLFFIAWIRFLETRKWRYHIAVLLLYAWLLFSYEMALTMPAALAVLIPWNRDWLKQAVRWMLPFGGVVAFYLTWRFTYAFGLGQNMLGTDTAFSTAYVANLWELRHNVLTILSWFAGPEVGRTFLNGLLGLRDAGPAMGLALFAGNLALAGWAWRRFDQPETNEPTSFRPLQVVAFGLVLAAGPAVLLSVTGPTGRTLFFVAIGLFFALCPLARLPWRHSSWMVPVLALVMLSTQGMGKNWEVGARLYRQLRVHLVDHRAEWIDKETLLIDTTALRQRTGASLLDAPPGGYFPLVRYRGAGLLRSFGPEQLTARVAGPGVPFPHVMIDVEHGARIDGDRLLFHDRFHPKFPRERAMDKVYVVELPLPGGP
jgi:hypothetical protein